MRPQDFTMLLTLSALWGASFLFMRIATPVLGPLMLIELRVGIAALALLIYSAIMRKVPELGKNWKHFLAIGLINSAIPFVLIATSTLYIPAGLAATVNATTPLFSAVISAWFLKEPLNLQKVAGLLLGFVGVGVLVGLGPVPMNNDLFIACALSILAAISYGFGAVYTKINASTIPSMALATYSQLFATLALLPVTPFVIKRFTPLALTSALALGLICTAVAYLLYFRLIQTIGATKTTMVTYLAPAFAIVWGLVFLQESLGLGSYLGFTLILGSVVLVSGNPFKR
jgi:drug/metabolite transporter (DMT)-like permease